MSEQRSSSLVASPDLLTGTYSDSRQLPSPLSDRALRVFLFLPCPPTEEYLPCPPRIPHVPRPTDPAIRPTPLPRTPNNGTASKNTSAPIFRRQIPPTNRDPLSDQAGKSLPPRKGTACSSQGEAPGQAVPGIWSHRLVPCAFHRVSRPASGRRRGSKLSEPHLRLKVIFIKANRAFPSVLPLVRMFALTSFILLSSGRLTGRDAPACAQFRLPRPSIRHSLFQKHLIRPVASRWPACFPRDPHPWLPPLPRRDIRL